ncbi:serine-rich adhesin for platelets [Labrus mixtus]|uniref:serine-rich adhesin for platelets n=1 Tax=Labrus mixtus TaxID=508554 RepID=UPI0029C076F3|nr:serine-rich adhesin for platelets [Labrus mixtus]
MEPLRQRGEASSQTSADELEAPSQSLASPDQTQPRLETDGLELREPWRCALQPDFQDSNLSPALHLLPADSGVEHNFTEYSLFHQSENEFVPLRAYPDISMASERSHFPPNIFSQASERDSLSQHPLTQATILSEEGASSCCSLSQHSLSPRNNSKGKERQGQGVSSSDDSYTKKKDFETLPKLSDKRTGDADEDETFFLSKDVPAQHLLDLLQKDFGMPSSSSSAVSSASETSLKTAASFAEQVKSTEVCKPDTDQITARREGPAGEVSLPQRRTQPLERDLYSTQSPRLPSEVCNITMGHRSTQPDESSEMLHRELLSEVERRNSCEAASKNKQQKSPTPPSESFTPYPQERNEGKPSVSKANVGGGPWTGPFSTGVERGLREHDLWSSGNQTGIDGSYLGFLPQSQSTPGVLKAPPKSTVKLKIGQLSDIESIKENSHQSSTGMSSQPALPGPDVQSPDTENQRQEEVTSAEVQSLPSVNFMQKVDAWRANQSSGKTSLFDSLALQGFSGVSPKKKAYEAVSDTLNRILSEQARSLQQPPVSSAANLNATQSSSVDPSASSPRRGEAVGSVPNEKNNTRPSASPYGRSQSHSSINTVMSVHKDQQTETPAENENSQSQVDVDHQQSAAVQPSPFMSLGQFSDVSPDRDSTLSSSQDGYNYEIKLETSIGASSVVSLEVDNYAPYWTSKLSTPPPPARPREFNIEERIPLYLHNLGIDQSPSTILTPFAPKGPIREPEFSPTDLSTIKGSIGTPTKSTQPSEGGSPQKGEFSRCSVLSVDSSVSIPFSLDSLGPAVSIQERPRRASPSSVTEAVQSEQRRATSSEPEEDAHPSTLQTALQQQRGSSFSSSQNTIRSTFQTSRSLEETAEDSFVSSNTLFEIRKLLSQAENVVSAGSSAASSASPAAPRLPPDNDIFLSLRKTASGPQESSFSSWAAEDPRTRSSTLWARSSSDPLLASDKVRERSIGRERMTSSSSQTNFPATGAHRRQQDNIVSRDAGLSFVLSQSARRSEPEGCSAAPPDNTVPPQQPITKPSPAQSATQLTSTPAADTTAVTEEETQTPPPSPVQSSSSSTIPEDQSVMSVGSSESSLAVRVAKLLQNESPSTMVSSTASTTDQEERQAREWIKLKISGQQCEPLELDKEDRRRIEEIKRELLLKDPIKSPRSTDTESSAASSVRMPSGKFPSQQVETLTSTADANKRPSQPQLNLSANVSASNIHLHAPLPSNLEAQVREIAAREGVTLPKTNPLALTSITIATRKRSTSSSPSTSPAPPVSPAPEMLHLNELSTEAVQHATANIHLPHGEEEDGATRNLNLIPQSAQGSKKRQDTVGGHVEEAPPPLQELQTEDLNAKDKTQLHRPNESGVGPEPGSSTGSSTSDVPPRKGHISHVHLTLSPKASDHSAATAVHSGPTAPPHEEFIPLRRSHSAASSPDEGVGLSSPPEWYDSRDAGRPRVTSALFKPAGSQRKTSTTSTQSFKPHQGVKVSISPSTTETPAVPVLLPYKPRGSEELFYVPQRKADFSSTDRSDTTMESSHTGSDDAVPPRFSSEVLGHKDPGLDRGVTIRHSEGIYSKRLKTTAFKMQEPERTGASVSADKTLNTSTTPAPEPSSQVSVAFTRVPLSSNQETSRRDQGTSPVQFLSYDHPETRRERIQSGGVDSDSSRLSHHRDQSFVHQERKDSDLPHPAAQPSISNLDQLWQRFCDRWSQEESRPTSDREASLLERLERLSRLIHSTRRTDSPGGNHPGEMLGRRGEDAAGRERKRDVREGKRRDVEPPVPRQAQSQKVQVQETSEPADEETHDSFTSNFSHNSSLSPYLCPADRDESETLSTASGSMSTVDTARLIRAFGPHRVQHLKTNSSLSKLYSAIDRQKEGREQMRGGNIITPSETTGTDESTVDADSASSTSTYTLLSQHGPSKRAVRGVNKGVQAGDLELVSNATRRHTRDVGTTFPSPAEARTSRPISSSSSSVERGRGGKRSLYKTQGLQKHRKSKKSQTKTFPQGVSWFISADELKSEARKENQPEEEEAAWRQSTAWFEPYSRSKPWREPLRQRQVHQDRTEQQSFIHQADLDLDPRAKMMSPSLARVSLQEALEMRRPDFISQSMQRVQRLALQAEDRRLQADFTERREREELFCRPGGTGRLPKPAGPALLRRAVPRKEMIQRSKQIYESLPEVQRRREEERRKAEYRSYRLNAQLYNKRITGHVLGRRTAWH